MQPVADHRNHRRQKLRRVLVIGMDHHHDVRAGGERETITGLLIPTVARVLLMHVDLHALQPARHRHRVIAALVIHEDDQIHDLLLAHFVVSLAHGSGGVIGRHDDDHFFSAIHFATACREARRESNPTCTCHATQLPCPR